MHDTNGILLHALYVNYGDFSFQLLDAATKVEYGYSYICGWLSMGIGIIGGILFVCAAWSVKTDKHREVYYFMTQAIIENIV